MDMDKTNPIASSSSSLASETKENLYGTNDNNNLSRATKNWKKIKDISGKEDKRPPWKVVSVSTLPKADKNALLRAKLLDASRRLRPTKVPVAIQTDIAPAKLLKEVNVDVQSDLIQMVDAGNITDGTITFKPDGPIILTYSVSQMTDTKETKDNQTQTATPAISYKFFDKYDKYHRMDSGSPPEDEDEDNLESDYNYTKLENKLLNQIREIRLLSKQIIKNSSDSNSSQKNDLQFTNDSSQFRNDLSNANTKKWYSLQGPTTKLWNFGLSDHSSKMMESCSISDTTNRSNDIFRLTRNMKLLPNSERPPSLRAKSKTYTMLSNEPSFDSTVLDLLNATNILLTIFKEIPIALGPDINISNVTKYLQNECKMDIQFQSDYWRPILLDIAQVIDQKLSDLENCFSNTNSKFK